MNTVVLFPHKFFQAPNAKSIDDFLVFICNAFGVWGLKKFMGKEYDGINRKTFIVDGDGKVERVIDKVKTKVHAAQILEADA